MGSFLQAATKQVTDVRSFLRDSAGGNSIKYAAEKGAKHIVYVPFTTSEVVDDETQQTVVQKNICAISAKIHEWNSSDGKYKAVACLKDTIRKADDGVTVLNDGTCPFCDRVSDAWDIYKYRKALEEEKCSLTGEARKAHLEKVTSAFGNERKAKDARPYMYILVVKFRLNQDGHETLGSDKLPEYDLKVMKLSASRVDRIQQQIANAGSELPGSELIFEYPSVDDRRLQVSQSTTAPVFPDNKLTKRYVNLLKKIDNDVAKFEWEGIEKAFPELNGMTSMEAKTTTDNLFEMWDAYCTEIKTNPTAKYMEYVVETPTTVPSLTGSTEAGNGSNATPNIAMPTIPIPTVPNVPTAPTIPNPTAPATDPNSVFSGAGASAPSITL